MHFESRRSLIELYLNLQCRWTDSVLIKSSILNYNIGGRRLFIYYIRENKMMNFIFNLHVYWHQCTLDTVSPLDNWYDHLHWTSKLDQPIQPIHQFFCSNMYGKSHLFHKKVYSTKSICSLFEKKKYTYTSTLHRGSCPTTAFIISNKSVSGSQPPSLFFPLIG